MLPEGWNTCTQSTLCTSTSRCFQLHFVACLFTLVVLHWLKNFWFGWHVPFHRAETFFLPGGTADRRARYAHPIACGMVAAATFGMCTPFALGLSSPEGCWGSELPVMRPSWSSHCMPSAFHDVDSKVVHVSCSFWHRKQFSKSLKWVA